MAKQRSYNTLGKSRVLGRYSIGIWLGSGFVVAAALLHDDDDGRLRWNGRRPRSPVLTHIARVFIAVFVFPVSRATNDERQDGQFVFYRRPSNIASELSGLRVVAVSCVVVCHAR